MQYPMAVRQEVARHKVVQSLVLGCLLVLVGSASAEAIPAFARKYRVSCQLCHNPVPTLTEFGENFAGNGFRFSADEAPRDTIDTGDQLLQLLEQVPLAIRFDAYAQALTNGFTSDFKTPYNLKILSGGALFKGVSYYFYFFLFERGEIGGIEDAFIYFNDVGGAPLDIQVGQFQVSDAMFKRELRLEFDDYAIYRARVGDAPQDLTYDRGISAMWDVSRLTLTGTAVNGNGKGPDNENRQFDNDSPKDYFAHLNWPALNNLRVGAMGYWGRQDVVPDGGAPNLKNYLWMVGADATVTLGALELNAQYIHREDDNPSFTTDGLVVQTDGGFLEAIYRLPGGRWYLLSLYNYVYADQPLLNVGLGGPEDIQKYHTITGGAGWMWRRNFRALVEGGWDIEQERTRWTVGLSLAF